MVCLSVELYTEKCTRYYLYNVHLLYQLSIKLYLQLLENQYFTTQKKY